MGLRAKLAGGLVLLGLAVGLQGLWIPAKGVFAQWLLERAWQASRAEGTPQAPWPWADTHPVGRLRVPALAVERIVLAGDDGRTLAFGPGLTPSAPGGLQVISGHKDTHFAFLARMRPGTRVEWQSATDSRWYRVTATEVIDSRRVRLDPASGRGLLLVTCYPFGTLSYGGPLRYLVWAAPEGGGRLQF